MKKLGILLFILSIAISLNATNYYVAPATATPAGNDGNPGTIGAPWLTWGKGFSSVSSGDTVFFRGGNYPISVTTGYGYRVFVSGSVGGRTCYTNYPGEVPVLDCYAAVPSVGSGTLNQGIRGSGSYIHFRGLTVINVRQTKPTDEVVAFYFSGSNNIIENCTVRDAGGVGFGYYGGQNSLFLNCDAYNCCDSLTAAMPGNDGAGFRPHNWTDNTATLTLRYCRAWNCGDQGFSAGYIGLLTYDGCWSFDNGQLQGEGHGFKQGWINTVTPDMIHRIYKNCIAANNDRQGFTTNDGGYAAGGMQLYNNTSYHNASYGFMIYNTTSSDAQELLRDYKNNISYANTAGATYIAANALYTHSYNTWDHSPPLPPMNDNQFLSVDSTGITGPRQADGSLPDIDFLKLSSTSMFIDAGTDLGEGDDIGAYQYVAPGVDEEAATVFTTSVYAGTNYANVGVYVYDQGSAEVTARGVCWSITPGPTIYNNKTSNGTGTGEFIATITGLLEGTLYYVRSYATNSVETAYSEVEYSFTTKKSGSGSLIQRQIGTHNGILRYDARTNKWIYL
ncbi:MAG TPA: right-handed parallel beta-helix repeat-containing protein [Bacteroidales bacterium]|nr:right-handed parallel beta-helix repeat-containing protein [Bacteroidales bacterium]